MAQDIEDRIRGYLDSLDKRAPRPKRVIDRDAVNAVKEQIRKAVDPIEKLKLYRELEEAQKPRLEEAVDQRPELEEAFVAHAKGWAEEQGIPVSAFVALKVPKDVLRRAGFTVTGAGRAVRAAGAAAGSRAPRLDLAEVKAAIADLPKTWTLKSLAERLDRDTATTRNYVKRLLDDGVLTIVGEDSSKQGRPAKIYALKK